MSDALLEVEMLNAGYGSLRILTDVDLTVPEGSVVGVVGPNGAGKTTLLRSISRMTRIFDGRIRFAGRDITKHSDADVARLGVAHVVEGRRVFKGLTVQDNLLVGAYARRDVGGGRLGEVLELFPRLGERLGQRAETLSGGEQQMLAIGRALMMGPRLMMLDEPSQGLSPAMVQAVLGAVAEVAKRGPTVVIVEQNVQPILGTLDFAVTMNGGRAEVVRKEEFATWDFRRLLAGTAVGRRAESV